MPQISEPQLNATSDGIDAGQAKGIDKEHSHGRGPASLSQPGAPSLRRPTSVSPVRPQALGPPPPRIYPAPCGSSGLAGREWLDLEDRGDVETQRTYRMSRTFRGSTRKATAADHAAAVGVTVLLTKPLSAI